MATLAEEFLHFFFVHLNLLCYFYFQMQSKCSRLQWRNGLARHSYNQRWGRWMLWVRVPPGAYFFSLQLYDRSIFCSFRSNKYDFSQASILFSISKAVKYRWWWFICKLWYSLHQNCRNYSSNIEIANLQSEMLVILYEYFWESIYHLCRLLRKAYCAHHAKMSSCQSVESPNKSKSRDIDSSSYCNIRFFANVPILNFHF